MKGALLALATLLVILASSVPAQSSTKASVQHTPCLKNLYVIAFTSNLFFAGSHTSHKVEITVKGIKHTLTLYNRPGNDMKKNKGDLWKFKLTSFGFPAWQCIRRHDIQNIAIVAGGWDGWNIQTIITLATTAAGRMYPLTMDENVNRWVDGNGPLSQRRFPLTKKYTTHG